MLSPLFRLSSVCVFLLAAVNAGAQSISLAGNGNLTVRDTDEYFTSVGQPKNFDSHCDVGRDSWYYTPKGSSNGVWSAVSPAKAGPYFSPMPIPTLGTFPNYREDCGGTMGHHHPLDASKYTYVSVRSSNSLPSSYAILWTLDPGQYQLQGYDDFDGYFLPGGGVSNAANVFTLHHTSLSGSGTPWTGNVYGLTIWPSFSLPAGGTTSVDWLRIIDPNDSPLYTIDWSSGGGTTGNDFVNIYFDTDGGGYDGSMITARNPVSGSYNFMTGLLAPGAYYFYVELWRHSGATAALVNRSNYVGPVTVNGKPTLRFSAPGRTSGPEYSRDELGDAWDMANQEDVSNLFNPDGTPTPASYRGFHDWSFQGGMFYATSDLDAQGFTVDTHMHLHIAANKPVNPEFYRYLCYRFQVDSRHIPRDGDIPLLNDAGWVNRVTWIKSGVSGYLGQTYPQEFEELSTTYPDLEKGFMTYCYDLWDETLREVGPSYRSSRNISSMRFDPMEARPETGFAVDWIGLFAENQNTPELTYTVQWTAADPENNSLTIDLYYDADRAGFDGTHIGTLAGQAAGAGSYTWNVNGVPAGSYYIYAVVSDGTNTSRFYSEVKVNITASPGTSPAPPATVCDYNGDGRSDFVVVRGNNGSQLVQTRASEQLAKKKSKKKAKKKKKKAKKKTKRPSSNGGTWHVLYNGNTTGVSQALGDLRYDVGFPADIDGDRLTDILNVNTRRATSGQLKLTGLSTYGISVVTKYWGAYRDQPVLADFDGDRIADFVVFRPSTGQWAMALSTGAADPGVTLGAAGDIPVAADFDGDGKADVATYRPANGVWTVLLSSRAYALTDALTRTWGSTEDYPMPGDYDGDGRADLTFYRPSNSTWYLCSSQSSFDCGVAETVQWGQNGDSPVLGDFDGDDKLDITVFRPAAGTFYVRQSSDLQLLTQAWGRNGDTLVCTSPRYLTELGPSS